MDVTKCAKSYNGFNLYRRLLIKLKAKDEPFGIISFNYDTLLDRALNEVFGFSPCSLQDYINFSYIKPHGSVNWFIRRKQGDQEISRVEGFMDIYVRINVAASQMYGQNRSVSEPAIWDPRHHQLDDKTVIATPGLGGMYSYPLVLLPLTTKLYDSFEGFKQSLLEPAQSLVTQAKEIYIIGYRAVDEVIREILEPVKLDTPFEVVSLEDAQKIADSILSWKRELKLRNIHDRGFLDFLSFRGF